MTPARKKAVFILAFAIPFTVPVIALTMWFGFPYASYRIYMAWLASGVSGGYGRLPAPLAKELLPKYRHDLGEARVAFTDKLPNGLAVADCKTVYFGNEKLVEALRQGSELTDGQRRWLAHELTHGEQCERWGGREAFAKTWFGQADASAWHVVKAGGAFDALREYLRTRYIRGLHDAMPMEIEADERAADVLRARKVMLQ